jgi:hypothetical protein
MQLNRETSSDAHVVAVEALTVMGRLISIDMQLNRETSSDAHVVAVEALTVMGRL